MAELAPDTPVGPGPLVRPEVELRVCQAGDLTRNEVVQLFILRKEHGTRSVVSDSRQVHRLPFVKTPTLWRSRERRRAALHRCRAPQAMTGRQAVRRLLPMAG